MINFTLKQMRYVEAAGRLGSISKAAEELAISQSSITAAIDAMEQSLDYDLFLRTPAKGIQPTPAGSDALILIRDFLHQARHFESELRSTGSDAAGLVRIACYATAAPAFLPPILKSMSERFPGISVKVMEGNMSTIVEFLDNGQVDLVFTYNTNLPKALPFEPLFDAPPYALISAQHPLATRKSVTYAQLAAEPLVLLDLPYTREYFLSLFERRGLSPKIAHSTRSAEIARALVDGGFGYTILNIRPPDYGDNDARYRAVPIADTSNYPVFGIATTSGARPPKTVQAFLGACLELRDVGAFRKLLVRA